MGVAGIFFEPQPWNFGKLDIFWRCSNDISTIFWNSLWEPTCQKCQKPMCPDNTEAHKWSNGPQTPTSQFVKQKRVIIGCHKGPQTPQHTLIFCMSICIYYTFPKRCYYQIFRGYIYAIVNNCPLGVLCSIGTWGFADLWSTETFTASLKRSNNFMPIDLKKFKGVLWGLGSFIAP